MTTYKVGDEVFVVLGDDQWHKGIVHEVFEVYGWTKETRYLVNSIGKPEFTTVVRDTGMRK